MPASLARIDANRRNALKSTGPKTVEGKARSRENGLKHGLTGEGVVMDPRSRSAVDARKARLLEQLAPSTELGEILVDRIAVLSVRLERSGRAEEANTSRRVREAPARFDDAREREELRLHRLLAAFGEEPTDETPGTVVRELRRSVGGIDHLLEAWRRLRASVEQSVPGAKYGEPGARYSTIEAERFDFIDGRYPDRTFPSEAYAAALRLNGGDASMKPVLCSLIDAAIAQLEVMRNEIDPADVEVERHEAAEMALFDSSKEGELRRRYEARTEGALFRAIQELRIAERPAKSGAGGDSEAKPKPPRPSLPVADVGAPAFLDVSASAPAPPPIPEASVDVAEPSSRGFGRDRDLVGSLEGDARAEAGEVPDHVPKWR